MKYYQDPNNGKIVGHDTDTDQVYELTPLVRLPVLEFQQKLAAARTRPSKAMEAGKEFHESIEEEAVDRPKPIEDSPTDTGFAEKKGRTRRNIDEIKPKIREMIAAGKKNNDICKELECSYSSVYQIRMQMIHDGEVT